MSYAIADIITWAKASQALAYAGERNKLAFQHGTIESNLDQKLYLERKSLEYAYAQDPTSNQTYLIGQWVLALCGEYLFEAQQATGGGGSISPINPSEVPEQLDFVIGASTPLTPGDSTAYFPQFVGYNLIFVRGNITQSVLTSQPTYYSWNKVTGQFTCSPQAYQDELFQLIPIV